MISKPIYAVIIFFAALCVLLLGNIQGVQANEICDLCKEMTKEARDQLLSNMTQEEIKEVFEGSCKLLSVKLVVDNCLEIVDEFVPEYIEMLASRMDPLQVCTVAGLCISGK